MKYIDAEKLIAYLNKTMQSYKSQMVDPRKYPIDHIVLMAFLAREYQAIIANVTSLQQNQPEVDFEKAYKSYMKSRKDDVSGHSVTVNMKELARHFAEWGATHLNNKEK